MRLVIHRRDKFENKSEVLKTTTKLDILFNISWKSLTYNVGSQQQQAELIDRLCLLLPSSTAMSDH